MKIKQSQLAAVIVTLVFLNALCVQAAEFKGVAGVGVDFGGDTLVTAVYNDGSTTDVKANNGFVVNVGGVMIVDSYETQATVGYKYGGPVAKNGSITWDAVPVEVIQFLRAANMRIGLGFSYQINPKLVIDIPGTNQTYNFDNAFGTIAQIGWAPVDMPFSIDLRYTAIKYRQSNVSNAEEKNGNVLGIYSSFFF